MNSWGTQRSGRDSFGRAKSDGDTNIAHGLSERRRGQTFLRNIIDDAASKTICTQFVCRALDTIKFHIVAKSKVISTFALQKTSYIEFDNNNNTSVPTLDLPRT